MKLETAGPILCAGITMYEPLKYWGALEEGKKMTIGIVGIGGLGTMGIKLAKAAGHDVVAISTSANKEKMSKEKGATFFVNSKDPKSMATQNGKIDMILDTVSANHQMAEYLPLLKTDGRYVLLGLALEPQSFSQLGLIFQRKKICGSLIGGIKSTEECLEFCAKHNINPDVTVIEAKDIEMAWNTLMNINKDGVRFVIDIKKSLANPEFIPK
jgi:alcohol dehydrogenase (NADP+)